MTDNKISLLPDYPKAQGDERENALRILLFSY